jgi:hypothetical protein
MKTMGVVILMLGCVAWSVRATYAGQSVSVSQQGPSRIATDTVGNHSRENNHVAPAGDGTHVAKPSEDQHNHPKISGNKSSTSITSPSKANHPNELENRRERSGSEDSKDFHRAGSDKSRGATQNGLARNETINHAASNRGPSAARPAVPALSNVRHRGANPAIIGGAGNSNSRNTTALDGTHMNRRRTGN